MSQTAKMNESIEHAFQALQTALVTLEKTVSERAETINAGSPGDAAPATIALSVEDKQAVRDELNRLKLLVSEASGLILSSQNGRGEG